jgi:hypothetical protein
MLGWSGSLSESRRRPEPLEGLMSGGAGFLIEEMGINN